MSPDFKKPPVVERVIGVQFSPLQFFTNAHAGWYWKSFLGAEWSQTNEVPAIEERFERFGSVERRVPPPPLRLMTGPTPERHQIIRKSDDMMIQVQNSRFLLNWRKKEGHDYLNYGDMLHQFKEQLSTFKEFVKEASGEELMLNQWEITYINHIPKEPLWNSIIDWKDLFPSLSLPLGNMSSDKLETMQAMWSMNLPDEAGRLHLILRHAIAGNIEGPEIILLDLTSRGSINEKMDFIDGINTGHNAIVNTFAEITSKSAHDYWGLQ